MIIFGSILNTFESSIIFGGSCVSIENWLKPKTEPHKEIKLAQICEILCRSTNNNTLINNDSYIVVYI